MAAGGDDGSDPSAAPDAGVVIVTITKSDDGSYMVYAGSPPDSSGSDADMSEDDADVMGGGDAGAGADPTAAGGNGMDAGAGAGGPPGQPADSIGAALKAALDILQGDKSSEGAPGNSDDQFSAGYSADKSPTPASGPRQKY